MYLPILKDCVLLGTRGMIDWNVCNTTVSPQEVSALSMNVHDWKHLIIFKWVETPPFFRDTCFRGLAVFNDYTSEGVCVLKKCPRKFKAWLFLDGHLFAFVVATRWRNQLLRLITTGTAFILLAMLPPSGIIKLPLCFLSRQVLKVSITSLSQPTPRSLVRGSPLVGVAPVPASVTTPGSPVFLSRWFPVLPIFPLSPGWMILTFLKFEQTQ